MCDAGWVEQCASIGEGCAVKTGSDTPECMTVAEAATTGWIYCSVTVSCGACDAGWIEQCASVGKGCVVKEGIATPACLTAAQAATTGWEYCSGPGRSPSQSSASSSIASLAASCGDGIVQGDRGEACEQDSHCPNNGTCTGCACSCSIPLSYEDEKPSWWQRLTGWLLGFTDQLSSSVAHVLSVPLTAQVTTCQPACGPGETCVQDGYTPGVYFCAQACTTNADCAAAPACPDPAGGCRYPNCTKNCQSASTCFQGRYCTDSVLTGGFACDTCIMPVCGNKIEEWGEQCDDGNTVVGDGCESCKIRPFGTSTSQVSSKAASSMSNGASIEFCGNGIVNDGEQCDACMPCSQQGTTCNMATCQCDPVAAVSSASASAPGTPAAPAPNSAGGSQGSSQSALSSSSFSALSSASSSTTGQNYCCVGTFCGQHPSCTFSQTQCLAQCGTASSVPSSSAASQVPLATSCLGNECGQGGSDFCGLTGLTCQPISTLPCIRCIDGSASSSQSSNVLCGNGTQNPGEQCDTGNKSAEIFRCRNNCTQMRCGDGIVDPGNCGIFGGVTGACTIVDETCDDGNTQSGDGCSAGCQTEGSASSAATTQGYCCVGTFCGQSASCTLSQTQCLAQCGTTDFTSSSPSSTSTPGTNSAASQSSLPTSCLGNECSQGGGNTFCALQNLTCQTTNDTPCIRCIDPNSPQAFSSSSTTPLACGNNRLDPGEQCDKGERNNSPGTQNGSGCACNFNDPTCIPAVPGLNWQLGCRWSACGDGLVNNDITVNGEPVNYDLIREECDDGNRKNNDGCSMNCKIETVVFNDPPSRTAAPRCGDGITDVQLGEDCDDGVRNAAPGTRGGECSCPPNTPGCIPSVPDLNWQRGCRWPTCGDGVVNNEMMYQNQLVNYDLIHEQCDDGNANNADGCSTTCQVELPFASSTASVPSVCSGNECQAGGATFCGAQNLSCVGIDTVPCIACVPQAASSKPFLECADNSQCPTGLCVQNRCVGCTNNLQCSSGLCIEGQCSPCSQNSQCQSNLCSDGQCIDCTQNDQCATGLCSNGLCLLCSNDTQCPDDKQCVNGSCIRCTEGAQCPTGLCLNNRCAPCTDSSQCGSQACVQGICQPLPSAVARIPGANNADISEFCGNGVLNPGEDCDAGLQNSTNPNAACRPDCTLGRCGDGILDTPLELCDDGNAQSGDGCSSVCAVERRGPDGQVLPGTIVELPFFPSAEVSSSPQTPVLDAQGRPVDFPVFNPVTGTFEPLPVRPGAPVTPDTGPATIAIMSAGAAAGYAYMRRRRKQ